MNAASPTSPIPRASIVAELIRSALMLILLLGTTIGFLIVGAWVLAAIFGLVTLAGVFSGAVAHPRQIRTAVRPDAVTYGTATPVFRRKQAWLLVDDGSGRQLALELRTRRLARQLGSATVPVTIAGDCQPGAWVVVQALRLTIWPAAKVHLGLPGGAGSNPDEPRRTGFRDLMR